MFQRNANETGFVGILQSMHHKVSLCGKEKKTSVQKYENQGKLRLAINNTSCFLWKHRLSAAPGWAACVGTIGKVGIRTLSWCHTPPFENFASSKLNCWKITVTNSFDFNNVGKVFSHIPSKTSLILVIWPPIIVDGSTCVNNWRSNQTNGYGSPSTALHPPPPPIFL